MRKQFRLANGNVRKIFNRKASAFSPRLSFIVASPRSMKGRAKFSIFNRPCCARTEDNNLEGGVEERERERLAPIFPWPFNESRISRPLVKNYPLKTMIVNRAGISRIDESVGRRPASCLHSSITECRENSLAYCS